jgi:hypothetical protein
MRTSRKPFFAALAAALIMSTAVSAAPARNLSFSERGFKIVWNESVGSRLTLYGLVANECDATLLGHFNEATMPKFNGHIADIDDVTFSECLFPTIDLQLPWNVHYVSFSGRLPEISEIKVRFFGRAILIDTGVSLFECLMRTDSTDPSVFELHASGGQVTALEADAFGIVEPDDLFGGGLCDLELFEYRGIAEVTDLSSEPLLIRLI